MPEKISKSNYQRLRGAYMGYNSFGGAMEYWPEARWGNHLPYFFPTNTHFIYSMNQVLFEQFDSLKAQEVCSMQIGGLLLTVTHAHSVTLLHLISD